MPSSEEQPHSEKTKASWSLHELPRRSAADRKIAGVAGGLGRAFRIDPTLIRVLLVILALFGGSGVLLYCLGWLLMTDDTDETSALESLVGRGRSSVSPALTIVLIIVAVASGGSLFSWGIPFWPVVIAAIVVFAFLWHRDDAAPETPAPDVPASQAPAPGAVPSPFDPENHNAREATDQSVTSEQPSATLATQAPQAPQAPSVTETPQTQLYPPPPAQPEAAEIRHTSPPTPRKTTPASSASARFVLGLALLAAGVLAAGNAAHWWSMPWASVSGAALGILGLGLLTIALTGGRGRGLIAPGLIVSVVTIALTVTGLSGFAGAGNQNWQPTAISAVDGQSFTWSMGQAHLDLTDLSIAPGTTVSTTAQLDVGQLTVVVPDAVQVDATCASRIGEVRCFDDVASGLSISKETRYEPESSGDHSADQPMLILHVRSNIGQVVVRHD